MFESRTEIYICEGSAVFKCLPVDVADTRAYCNSFKACAVRKSLVVYFLYIVGDNDIFKADTAAKKSVGNYGHFGIKSEVLQMIVSVESPAVCFLDAFGQSETFHSGILE